MCVESANRLGVAGEQIIRDDHVYSERRQRGDSARKWHRTEDQILYRTEDRAWQRSGVSVIAIWASTALPQPERGDEQMLYV